MAAMPGDAPILVNSAGCGAALEEYGHLLGTDEARAFSARVVDVHEWVAERLDVLPRPLRRLGPVIVQDPCHLRHVQRAHLPVRRVLATVADPVELDDDGLCCGAGGAYAALQPHLAGGLRERKMRAIARASTRSGTQLVVSANPGCLMHLSGPEYRIVHPMQLVAAALRGGGP
jgi:glycolate oxidase iron-sulfur subunit